MTGRPLWWAIGLTAGVGAATTALGFGWDVLFGMGAPLVAAATSWMLMTRIWATAPETLLSVMVRSFVTKCLFFVAYVTVMVKGLEVRPEPFVASLTVSFVVLHMVEAWCLKRLMQNVIDGR